MQLDAEYDTNIVRLSLIIRCKMGIKIYLGQQLLWLIKLVNRLAGVNALIKAN